MLIGYVSDEEHSALADVILDFTQVGKYCCSARSTASGAVYSDIPPGDYLVTLAKDGYGSKRVEMEVREDTPYSFRLLSDTVTGYIWPKWVQSGQMCEFKVHSVKPYRLSLYRYGLKKELISHIGWYDAHGPRTMMQITPDGDYTTTGVSWNKIGWGSPHHAQQVLAPERSGLYYFHVRTDSGRFFTFPWVVAPAVPQSEIAVLTSTNTWNAYNSFGGRSNYVNARRLPLDPTVNARQDLQRYRGGAYEEWIFANSEYLPLSFERPERGCHIPENTEVSDPIEGRDACHLAPAEWRTLGWLEREGFNYDLYSDYQLHSGILDLAKYRVLILSVHPEYWSRAMFARVKDWVNNQGGKLLYLGGNGLNCEVEFVGQTAIRCLTKIPGDGKSMSMIDTTDCGILYESRFHQTYESEASLLGVSCTDAGIMTASPYQVVDDSHWAYAGTGLKSGEDFGFASLHERIPGGASGHETDKRSPSSPAQTVLLAKGRNPDEGGAEMTYHETSSGGAVFSVGSITYPASLLIDENISRITRNVLERFLA